MATTTPNFGWVVPTSTDLVKDGATAIETLGDSIDASLVDLKGGTSGQVLKKNSNTDMDFVWGAVAGDIEGVTAGVGITGGGTSGTVTITNDMATTITAAGDIVVGTGSGTYDNLPIGTTNQILTADTTVSPYKVKWATPAGGGKIAQVVSAVITTNTSSTSTSYVDATDFNLSITPTSATSKVLVIIAAAMGAAYSSSDNSGQFSMQLVRVATSIFDLGRNNWWEENTSSSRTFRTTVPMTFLDSPATTSSTNYKLQIKNSFGGNVQTNPNSAISTITLLEVLA